MIRHALFLGVSLALSTSVAQAATKYVRTDGGTASQCNGTVDAAYPGSGTGLNCAWNHPSWALGMRDGGTQRLSAGDILVIKNGSYSVGYGAPSNTEKSGCSSSSPHNCYFRSPPNNVIIRGEEAGNCRSRPEIWGTDGVRQVFTFDGTSGVTLECIEITDHSNCLYGHYNSSITCTSSKDYARHGVHAWNASNLTFRDLNIHGIGQNCYKGSKINNFTLIRTKLIACGDAGFHGATDGTTDNSFSGVMTFLDVEIAWNGCTENYPTLKIHGCFGQEGGGFGDGLGTDHTAGTWNFDRVYVHNNTSDGLDLRYTTDNSAQVNINRSWFYNNAGNQVKVWGKVTMENSVAISYCNYFADRYDTMTNSTDPAPDPEPCRADGNTVFIMVPQMTGIGVILRHNTITGHSSQLIQLSEDDGPTSASIVRIENNVLVGDDSFANPGSLTKLVGNTTNATVEWYHNTIHRVSGGSCPSGSSCVNPLLGNLETESFDPRPQSGSPVIGAASTSCGATACVRPTVDILGRTRPNPASRGAFEYSP